MKTEEHPRETNLRLGSAWLADLSMFAVRGSEAPRIEAEKIFEEHGFQEAFKDPGAESLLKRATRQGRKPRGYVCREFARPDKDTPLSFGIYRVDAVAGETGDEHSCVARVRLEKQYDPKSQTEFHIAVPRPPGANVYDPITDPEGMDWANNVATRANELLQKVDASDLGNYLRYAAEGIGCSKSLGGGNNYIVPPLLSEKWYNFLTDLSERIGIWHERIVLNSEAPQNARVVTEAATASLDSDLKILCEDLKKAIENKSSRDEKRKAGVKRPGRGVNLAARVQRAEELRAKAGLYAELLGDKRSELETLVETLNGHFNTLLDGGEVERSEADLSWGDVDDGDTENASDSGTLGW